MVYINPRIPRTVLRAHCSDDENEFVLSSEQFDSTSSDSDCSSDSSSDAELLSGVESCFSSSESISEDHASLNLSVKKYKANRLLNPGAVAASHIAKSIEDEPRRYSQTPNIPLNKHQRRRCRVTEKYLSLATGLWPKGIFLSQDQNSQMAPEVPEFDSLPNSGDEQYDTDYSQLNPSDDNEGEAYLRWLREQYRAKSSLANSDRPAQQTPGSPEVPTPADSQPASSIILESECEPNSSARDSQARLSSTEAVGDMPEPGSPNVSDKAVPQMLVLDDDYFSKRVENRSNHLPYSTSPLNSTQVTTTLPNETEAGTTIAVPTSEEANNQLSIASLSTIPDIGGVPTVEQDQIEEGSSNAELYCICKKPYADTWMIACDRCEGWFHGECVSLTESDSDLINSYICDACSNAFALQTTWHTKCRLPDCRKPAALKKNSAYCSHSHGLLFFKMVLSHVKGAHPKELTMELRKLISGQVVNIPKLVKSSTPRLTPKQESELAINQKLAEDCASRIEYLEAKLKFIEKSAARRRHLSLSMPLPTPPLRPAFLDPSNWVEGPPVEDDMPRRPIILGEDDLPLKITDLGDTSDSSDGTFEYAEGDEQWEKVFAATYFKKALALHPSDDETETKSHASPALKGDGQFISSRLKCNSNNATENLEGISNKASKNNTNALEPIASEMKADVCTQAEREVRPIASSLNSNSPPKLDRKFVQYANPQVCDADGFLTQPEHQICPDSQAGSNVRGMAFNPLGQSNTLDVTTVPTLQSPENKSGHKHVPEKFKTANLLLDLSREESTAKMPSNISVSSIDQSYSSPGLEQVMPCSSNSVVAQAHTLLSDGVGAQAEAKTVCPLPSISDPATTTARSQILERADPQTSLKQQRYIESSQPFEKLQPLEPVKSGEHEKTDQEAKKAPTPHPDEPTLINVDSTHLPNGDPIPLHSNGRTLEPKPPAQLSGHAPTVVNPKQESRLSYTDSGRLDPLVNNFHQDGSKQVSVLTECITNSIPDQSVIDCISSSRQHSTNYEPEKSKTDSQRIAEALKAITPAVCGMDSLLVHDPENLIPDLGASLTNPLPDGPSVCHTPTALCRAHNGWESCYVDMTLLEIKQLKLEQRRLRLQL